MDDVARRLGDPDLSLPGDLGEVPRHSPPGKKRGNEDQSSLRPSEQLLQLIVPLEANGAMARNGLNEDEPVLLGQMNHNVGHLPVLIHCQTQPL